MTSQTKGSARPLRTDGKTLSSNPLKILQVSPDLEIGGLQRIVLDLSQSLSKLGQEVHVISLRGAGPLMEELVKTGIKVISLPFNKEKVDRLTPLKIFQLLRKEKYHVIHTHNTQTFIEAGAAAFAARTPVRIHTDHNRIFPDRRHYMILERMFSWTYDKVVGVSEYTAESLHKFESISKSKLMAIPNGIRPEPYLEAFQAIDRVSARRQFGLEGFSTVFGLGSRMEPLKGLSHLLDAMPAILARHRGVCLALAGPGSAIPDLKAQAAKLGITENVRFLPPMPSLTGFYPLLDFLVLPSLSEGMPLCILEGMCLGLPVIATKVGGIPEILRHKENSLLIEPGRSEELETAICMLLDDPGFAARLANRAREDFHLKYRSHTMAKNYLSLYRNFMGNPGGLGLGSDAMELKLLMKNLIGV